MASFATDGSHVCETTPARGDYRDAGSVGWNDLGEYVVGNEGAYSNPGLYVVAPDQSCAVRELARDLIPVENGSGFQGAVWSPDGEWIAAILKLYGQELSQSVVLVSADATTKIRLVPDGVNSSPLFSPDGDQIYYVRAGSVSDAGVASQWQLWTVDVATHSAHLVFDIPEGWMAWPSGWTDEGYLILRLNYACDYYFAGSCGSRIAIIDSNPAEVIYLSAQRDFTKYVAFVP
jgi:Tol biopolymer transport system component